MSGVVISKPCPFCGEKGISIQDDWGMFRAFCMSCKAQTHWFITAELAVKKWNNRKIEESMQIELDKARKIIEVYEGHMDTYQTRMANEELKEILTEDLK